MHAMELANRFLDGGYNDLSMAKKLIEWTSLSEKKLRIIRQEPYAIRVSSENRNRRRRRAERGLALRMNDDY
jgi:hypothetical protein